MPQGRNIFSELSVLHNLELGGVGLAGGLAEKLEATAAAGFKRVEIFENDLLSFNGTPTEVARRCRSIRTPGSRGRSPTAA